MPEKTVLKLFEHEVGWEERRIPSTVDRIDDTSFIGEFVAHPVCCARADGTQQTFTVHVSSPDDSKFVPLPRLPLPIEPVSAPKTGKKPQPKKSAFYCAPCHSLGESNSHKENEQCQPSAITKYQSTDIDADAKRPRDKEGETDPLNIPTAEFVNTLKIARRISAKARGKELVIAICNEHTGMNFVMCVTFGLEGHCFWIPTQMYRWIVSQEPVPRGETSYAYPIKDEDVDGPATGCKVSIQAAFIRPEYTLIFVDHNSLIQFHVMQMPERFTADDLRPGSEFWPALWSQSHGPVYSQEPEATIQALEDWRTSILNRPKDLSPIAACMRANQMAFNGSGAQETSDQLFLALIHPQMPAYYDRTNLAAPSARLPAVSGPRPFYMNLDGHTKYLHHVLTYRRFNVFVYQDLLQAAHELGLFLPNAIIQPNGCAEQATLCADRDQKFIKAPNFLITIGKIKCYTPFTAQPGPMWKQGSCERVIVDVKDDVNNTTLGLYSFRVFVDCVCPFANDPAQTRSPKPQPKET
ncbi:hypothetical protein B0H14DRAFT_3701606 [Mycena olivaceomarginata]|nr:hypothetical protein B0H14DRAFT_3701606 [Mycena olivaceomarginata]